MSATASQAVLAAWLFASAFLWPHSSGQLLVALLGGALCALLSVGALITRRPDPRSRTLAWWMILGALLLPALDRLSVAHDVIVGVGILAFSRIARASSRLTPHSG
jgi:hypothetical protein